MGDSGGRGEDSQEDCGGPVVAYLCGLVALADDEDAPGSTRDVKGV